MIELKTDRENGTHGCQVDDACCSGLQWYVGRESGSRADRGNHVLLERAITRVAVSLARPVDSDSIVRSKGGDTFTNLLNDAGERST